MKKLMIVIFIFIVLLVGSSNNKSFTLLDYFSGEYTVYTTNGSGSDSVDLGFCYMNSKPVSANVVGESMVVENLEIGNVVDVLQARVVKTEYLDNGTTVIYAYTNLILDKVKVDGKHVNLQIATNDEYSVIGWPLILGSY
ncbi:MAG: hypothetical protein IKY10_05135 [Clostridia bacterium]|nr:hypothetical protein [Clostridia bacterium]